MKNEIRAYGEAIRAYARKNYRACFREPSGIMKHRFIVPGSTYSDSLWDWDSWLVDLALRRVADGEEILPYEQGCVLNFLDAMDARGRMPIMMTPRECSTGEDENGEERYNIHKPCIAQHALFISDACGDVEWLRDRFPRILRFLDWYRENALHESGLYVWISDNAIGVDNDPCTFYRPRKSSASIYLNCLLYRELLSAAELAARLSRPSEAADLAARAEALKAAIRTHCWDERDGAYYSVDVNLVPIDPNGTWHAGCPRHWSTLLQRFDVWSNFLPLWAGIATEEEARRMVEGHYKNERTFLAPYGVRTLGRQEKMYAIIKSGNPSCWLGPIWGIANYMVFCGLVRYGFTAEARDLAEKTVTLFGKDLAACGELHEYYHPDTGEGIMNPGFQNWNLLSINMYEWLLAEEEKA